MQFINLMGLGVRIIDDLFLPKISLFKKFLLELVR